jgi:hypothetical protein
MVPTSGIVIAKSERISKRQEWPADQKLPGIQLVLEALPVLFGPERLRRPDVQELAGVIPFVDGLVDIYALVALETDERCVEQAREDLRHLGLTDPCLPLQKKRPGELQSQEDRRGEALVRQVTVLPEPPLELQRMRNAGGQSPPASVTGFVQRFNASSTARRVHTRARCRLNSAEAASSAAGLVPSSAELAASST